MKFNPLMVAALGATADLLEKLIAQQKAGPGRGYSRPRTIECTLMDTCDAGGESVDAFEFEDGEAEALVAIIRVAIAPVPEDARTGWTLLPPEPTRRMLDAFHDAGRGVYWHHQSTFWKGLHYSDSDARYVAAYKAMLAAAPAGTSPQTQTDTQDGARG